ncbi:hypothetical protein V6N13_048676 [Hibiscus sabdariffa]
MTTGNGMVIEDDVWNVVVARLGLINDKPVWGYVEPEPNQPERNYPAYEPPTHMYEVGYAAMRDWEHEACDRMVTLQADATSMRVRTFDPNGAEFTVEAEVRVIPSSPLAIPVDVGMMFDRTVKELVLVQTQYSVQMSLLQCADMRSHQLLDIYELVVPKDY